MVDLVVGVDIQPAEQNSTLRAGLRLCQARATGIDRAGIRAIERFVALVVLIALVSCNLEMLQRPRRTGQR
jgi:hypothetical protein